jgi:enoyl-CoA hydratase/carnithine racemase
MRAGLDGALARGIEAEREAFAALFTTGDRSEGMRAFLERRPAEFQGK